MSTFKRRGSRWELEFRVLVDIPVGKSHGLTDTDIRKTLDLEFRRIRASVEREIKVLRKAERVAKDFSEETGQATSPMLIWDMPTKS